jgi:predicted ATP-grasp superfamily ATP-dependent carboligase
VGAAMVAPRGCFRKGRQREMVSSPGKRLRILLSEGSSTSARQALTVLASKGHAVDVCDPDAHCLTRFSRLATRFHRCPPLRDDPFGYLAFVEDLLARYRYDVLLPIHEQGFLFARVQERLAARAAIALPSFESYRTALTKTGFSRLLHELSLPQPAMRIVKRGPELQAAIRYPCVVKIPFGTASRGTAVLRCPDDLAAAQRTFDETGAAADEVLLQDLVPGTVEHAQAVFCRGDLIGFHANRQLRAGAGGGDALKESVLRPQVRAHLAQMGAHLAWHGALSVDYILHERDRTPSYIDCNPRLVEPMNAALSGVDLIGLLVSVSLGKRPVPAPEGRAGTRSHLGIQALLGRALAGGTRREIVREACNLVARRGHYAGSVEELTPVAADWPSALPLIMTMVLLLGRPLVSRLQGRGWGSHLLGTHAIALIEQGPGGRST